VHYSDPFGEDVVLRGAGENDVDHHMKIQLQYADENGRPQAYTLSFGSEITWSNFGRMFNPWDKQAEVYEDDCDGPELKRRRLTADEDQKVLEWMKNMRGEKMHYDVFLNSCHHFSKDAYRFVEDNIKGK
jgi:hypothetical protein